MPGGLRDGLRDGSRETSRPTSPAPPGEDKSPAPTSESFRVFARIRPPAYGEAAAKELRIVRSHGQQCIVQAKNLEFLLDHVWDVNDSQDDVYDKGARERVSWVLDGFNSTILCYGQARAKPLRHALFYTIRRRLAERLRAA